MTSSPTRSASKPSSLTDSLARPRILHRGTSSSSSSSSSLSTRDARFKAALLCENLGITTNHGSTNGTADPQEAGPSLHAVDETQDEDVGDPAELDTRGSTLEVTNASGSRGLAFGTSAAVMMTPGSAGNMLSSGVPGTSKDVEMARLRTQLREMAARNAVLEKDKRMLVQAAAEEQRKRDASGFDARQVEEMEAAFASQEALLVGYQREAETSFSTIETLKRQQRRLSEFITAHFGPAELALLLDDSTALGKTASAAGSPVVRGKLSAAARRASMGMGGTLSGVSSTTSSSGLARFEPSTIASSALMEDEESSLNDTVDRVDVQGGHAGSRPNQPDARALEHAAHLEQVTALVQALESRLMERAEVLREAESTARREMADAESKSRVLEQLVERLAPAQVAQV